MLEKEFFDRDAKVVAADLLGKVIRKRDDGFILSAMIVEVECYFITEKGSHASLGYTEKRKALFMDAGTIYMYYARGKDSLNVSCKGEGNAVLIKGATPFIDRISPPETLEIMHRKNPVNGRKRPLQRLCSGQTLLCTSLGITVPEWDQKQFKAGEFYFEDVGYLPEKIIQTTRLGIPEGRGEELPYRFLDYANVKSVTENPLAKREPNYTII